MFYTCRGSQAAIPAEWKRALTGQSWCREGAVTVWGGGSWQQSQGLRLMACVVCSQWSLQTRPTSQLERNACRGPESQERRLSANMRFLQPDKGSFHP